LPLILNIDCATPYASVCICKNGEPLAYAENETQKEHASFLHPAIQNLLKHQDLCIDDIDAFAITHGPGSYTGLRVSMATAKGLCIATQKPLITINTLVVIASAAGNWMKIEDSPIDNFLFCPMIDARRMEVFTAIYDEKLAELVTPHAAIVDANFLDRSLISKKIIFCGDGSHKAGHIKQPGDQVLTLRHSSKDLGLLSHTAFVNNDFANVAYSQPLYIKDFHFVKSVPNV
jgi:tRNA threonylcarbamoyladenosine biosynthesis protein TsaB